MARREGRASRRGRPRRTAASGRSQTAGALRTGLLGVLASLFPLVRRALPGVRAGIGGAGGLGSSRLQFRACCSARWWLRANRDSVLSPPLWKGRTCSLIIRSWSNCSVPSPVRGLGSVGNQRQSLPSSAVSWAPETGSHPRCLRLGDGGAGLTVGWAPGGRNRPRACSCARGVISVAEEPSSHCTSVVTSPWTLPFCLACATGSPPGPFAVAFHLFICHLSPNLHLESCGGVSWRRQLLQVERGWAGGETSQG